MNHAFVYVGQGRILEARPRGARFSPQDSYPGTIWLTNITPPAQDSCVQERVASGLRGVPYNFLDLIAIGIAQRRWNPDLAQRWDSGHEPWWVRRVADPDSLICSALCDRFYLLLGRHLFDDGRLEGLVSPGDLLALNESLAEGRP